MSIESILLVLLIVWIVGIIFRRLSMPAILGELLAGVLFGPALLGLIEPNETIKILAELGIFFLMLHAGLETDPKDLLHSSKTALLTGLGGILFPLILGFAVSKIFGYNTLTSMFIGVSLSITAISVSAKVFKDFKINNSAIAHTVMGAAIADDILAFIMLSVLLGFKETGMLDPMSIAIIIGKVILFFSSVLLIGEKILPSFNKIFQSNKSKAFTFTLLIALSFGLFAEWIGLHYILGAYLAGLFVKEEIVDPKLFSKIEDRLHGLSYSFLGPFFFISLGFDVNFGILTHSIMLPFLAVVILCAIVGKVFGAGLIIYFSKKDIWEAMIGGLAMNSRGAVELIIASIGLSQGIIDNEIFSILIFMAFFTTLISPLTIKFVLSKAKQAKHLPQ